MFDIGSIRAQLNELAFQNGRRAVSLGDLSELFPEKTREAVDSELQHLEAQLRRHDLLLERGDQNPERLYAVQTLKYRAMDMTWLAKGMQWVAQITTAALEMVVPAAVGVWLDQKLETSFLGLAGILLGVPLGIWHLVLMTKRNTNIR